MNHGGKNMFREMRRKKQQISKEECINILNQEKRGALAVNGEDGYPYVIPVNFYYDEPAETLYFHGAKTGHKIDSIQKDSKKCVLQFGRPVRVRRETGLITCQALSCSERQVWSRTVIFSVKNSGRSD